MASQQLLAGLCICAKSVQCASACWTGSGCLPLSSAAGLLHAVIPAAACLQRQCPHPHEHQDAGRSALEAPAEETSHVCNNTTLRPSQKQAATIVVVAHIGLCKTVLLAIHGQCSWSHMHSMHKQSCLLLLANLAAALAARLYT